MRVRADRQRCTEHATPCRPLTSRRAGSVGNGLGRNPRVGDEAQWVGHSRVLRDARVVVVHCSRRLVEDHVLQHRPEADSVIDLRLLRCRQASSKCRCKAWRAWSRASADLFQTQHSRASSRYCSGGLGQSRAPILSALASARSTAVCTQWRKPHDPMRLPITTRSDVDPRHTKANADHA